jgi:hypothetical protein
MEKKLTNVERNRCLKLICFRGFMVIILLSILTAVKTAVFENITKLFYTDSSTAFKHFLEFYSTVCNV